MPNITLPDGKIRQYDSPLSIFDVAKSLASSLAKIAVAGRVDGQLVDLSYVVEKDCALEVVKADDPLALEILRHSCAHLLAQAVKQLFPAAQVVIGPVIEDGFYYDFSYERPFTKEDLRAIEDTMQVLAKANYPITRRVVSRDEAIAYFREIGELYKVKIIEDIPENEQLSLYRQGDFEDLCRGPHLPFTGFLKAFKLTKLSGAYWRGQSQNEMLQRIYGTAWANKEDLNRYLLRIEEAEKRDHRKLGKSLELFHFQDISPGMVFWHPKGWTVYQLLESYMRQKVIQCGYQEIKTPQLMDKILWEKSGHWDNFRQEMFVTETENREYAIKPMSCPGHVQIYNQGIKSYRDLPLRYAEFGNCHRCEPSGALHGLMRVRNMVQDDGHIFCTEDQIQQEVASILKLVQAVYHDFGFDRMIYRLALRPENRVGSNEVWDKAEKALAQAMRDQKINWQDAPGEGAFYGPKIECSLADSLGRIWQCGTIQIDFSMPERLEAEFVAESGEKRRPVMIHRAILGSMERFIGILIEHYAGCFPLWLAPVQVMVLPISEKHNEYVKQVHQALCARHIRTSFDLRNEKVGFKIREHTLQKVPYFFVAGDKEVESRQVSVRSRSGNDMGIMTIDAICDILQQKINTKQLEVEP